MSISLSIIEEISFDQIIEQFKINSQLNFIAFAITIHHVNAIDVCLKKLKKEGIELKGYILLVSHPITGIRISEKDFLYLSRNINVCRLSGNINSSSTIRCSLFLFKSFICSRSFFRKIYIASAGVDYRLVEYIESRINKSKVNFILLDDGSGSYVNPFFDAIQSLYYSNFKTVTFTMLFKTFIRIFTEQFFIKFLSINSSVVDFRIFNRKKCKNKFMYEPKQDILFYYLELFKKISDKIPEEITALFENKILINTQCLKECSMTNGVVDFEIIKDLVNGLRRLDFEVVIKTHPRELDTEKYHSLNCVVYSDTSYSQESIIAGTSKKPICVVSFCSSTLLNLSGVYKIPAISLAKVLRNNSTINKTLVRDLIYYEKVLKNCIFFPETIEDTVNIINNFKAPS